MNKNVIVDYDICDPHKCDPEKGICAAALSCRKTILEQEEPFESPMVMSQSMCIGCGDCVTACPLGAVKISRGGYS